MGYDFVLANMKGRVVGDWAKTDYLQMVDKDGDLFVYEFPEDVMNLQRVLDEFVGDLKAINPREVFSAIYVSDFGEFAYEFTVENGFVKVYSIVLKPFRSVGNGKYEEVPGVEILWK